MQGNSPDDAYSLVRSVPLSIQDLILYYSRLLVLFFVHPVLWWEYQRAKRLEGYKNPFAFVQALSLRLGTNADKYDLPALRPVQVARVVRSLRGLDD